MNLQTFVNQNNGKTVGGGQCGDLVDAYLVDVFGNHTTYGTALNYWTNGIPGFSVVTTPEAGDIACYNAHPGFPDGHIAIYNGNGEVFEQNADPDGSPAHLYARANTYLLGYLRSENNMNNTPNMNEGDIVNLWNAFENKQPAQADITNWITDQGGNWKEWAYQVGIPLAIQMNKQIASSSTPPTILTPGTYEVQA